MAAHLLSSNLMQILLTCAAGFALFLAARHRPWVLEPAGYGFAICILVSSLFGIGEVYDYSDWYRRAFFYFGDDATTIAVFFALYAVERERRLLAVLSFIAVVVSGGKAPMLLFMLASALMVVHLRRERPDLGRRMVTLAAVAVVGYMGVTASSRVLERVPAMLPTSLDAAVGWVGEGGGPDLEEAPPPVVVHAGNGACAEASTCIATQLLAPVRQRVFSTVGGVWMMLNGGYGGEDWPGTADAFADLMMDADPWGINDAYGISRDEWRAMGQVQNPYVKFGAGYGLPMFATLVLAVLALNVAALQRLRRRDTALGTAVPLYFMVFSLLNQTQSWLEAGSVVLVLLAYCTSAILFCDVKVPLRPSRTHHFPRHVAGPEVFAEASGTRQSLRK